MARDEIRDAYNSNFDEKKAEIEANPAAFSDDIKQFYTEANKAKQVALKMQRNGAVWEWLSNRRKEAKKQPGFGSNKLPEGSKEERGKHRKNNRCTVDRSGGDRGGLKGAVLIRGGVRRG